MDLDTVGVARLSVLDGSEGDALTLLAKVFRRSCTGERAKLARVSCAAL